MSAVPQLLCNLRNKTIDDDNDLIRCMYYYMMYDGGATKMVGTLNDIMNDDILDQEDMAMIHSCISSLVPGSIDLGVETKESWADAAAKCSGMQRCASVRRSALSKWHIVLDTDALCVSVSELSP